MFNAFNAYIQPSNDRLGRLLGIQRIPVASNDEKYVMDEDGVFRCAHVNHYVERACCSSRGSSGYIECGCGGRDEFICPNQDCTGIEFDQYGDIK